ncbi:MAG: RcnB family protein [Sphingobium sp.]
MKKIILASLMAATAITGAAIPATASAQSAREVHDSRRDLREERRELQQAYRYGDRRDVREEHRDVRKAEREYAKDLRDYRRAHRNVYQRGNWQAPFRYHRWEVGNRMNRGYYGSRYIINDPWRYRLPRATGHLRWIRHYDDVLLVNLYSGQVITAYHNFFW